MGLFHCPVGAAYYDDDDCIDCGMCCATTSAEKVEASKKIRAYFKAHAVKNAVVRKIAVCGKGGVGKSTVTVLLAHVLREAGTKVLVLDTDESNPGLFRMLGFSRQPRALITALREPSPDGTSADASWLNEERIFIESIPAEYIIRENGFRFLMVGKIEDPFQGCACSMAGVARELMGKLVVEDGELVVIDMEAGIESFGRGVERHVDAVLAVVEPSYESIALAEKIAYMAEGMGIGRVRALLNKVPSERVGSHIADELSKKGVKIGGTVYFDARVNEAGFEGKPIATATASDDMKTVVKSVLDSDTGVSA